jgi:hypothetical protein
MVRTPRNPHPVADQLATLLIMVDHGENCACRVVAGAQIHHELFLAHAEGCSRCTLASGSDELCPVGRSHYLPMLERFREDPTIQRHLVGRKEPHPPR